MSDEMQQKPLTFKQIALSTKKTGVAEALWNKAHAILTRQPKILRKVEFGGSTYLVSPELAETYTEDGEEAEIRYTVAALSNNGKLTSTYFIVINDNFERLVQINHPIGSPPLVTYDASAEPVEVDDINTKLDAVLAATEKAARNYRGPIKRASDKSKGFAAPVAKSAVVIGVAAGLLYGGVSWIDWLNEDAQYAAAFDAEHPNYVVDGIKIQRGEEVVLKSSLTDDGIYIPRATDNEVMNRPRWTTVGSDTCSSGQYVRKAGYLNNGDHLIAQTSNSDDVVRIRVSKDGLIDFCAYRHGGERAVLTLQTQPNAA